MSQGIIQLITVLTAVWGAVTGTLSLALRYRDKGPRLVITAEPDTVPSWHLNEASATGPPPPIPVLRVHLANPTDTPTHVRNVYLVLGRNRVHLTQVHQMYENYNPPFTVEPYNGHDFYSLGSKLVAELGSHGHRGKVSMRLVVDDELGRTYRSAVISLDLQRLA